MSLSPPQHFSWQVVGYSRKHSQASPTRGLLASCVEWSLAGAGQTKLLWNIGVTEWDILPRCTSTLSTPQGVAMSDSDTSDESECSCDARQRSLRNEARIKDLKDEIAQIGNS